MTTGTVAKTDKHICCKLHAKRILAAIDLPALSEVFARRKSASILGGNTAKAEADRFSYWAAEPKEVFEFKAGQKNPLGKLEGVLSKYKLVKHFDVDSRLRGNDKENSGNDKENSGNDKGQGEILRCAQNDSTGNHAGLPLLEDEERISNISAGRLTAEYLRSPKDSLRRTPSPGALGAYGGTRNGEGHDLVARASPPAADEKTRPGWTCHGMFCGGWVGYFGYELGRYIEPAIGGPETTIDDLKMPLIRLCFYDRLIAYDHIEGAFWLIGLEMPGDSERPQEKLAALEQLLAESRKIRVPSPAPADLDNIDFSRIRCNMDKDYYLRMVEKIKRYIYDGDVYQINFSQRFECDYNARPIDLFHWENHYNPSGYAAYIDGGDFHIVSASPEMFITISDGLIRTKPIKGTRRRLDETRLERAQAQQVNAKNFRELLGSEKERAELNMIIDLERNDVAKICEPGTRTVVQPRTIEAYPTVFHAVATVGGRLRKEITFCDIIRAMFPGGSITGAPKIRSMEIIDETEPTSRGVYTGSIGLLGIDGNVCLNIAIRTIIIAAAKAFAQTGGGIVADSDPQAEWQETITKARALLAGIRAVQET